MVHSSTEIACTSRMLYILLAVSKADHKNEDCLVVVVLTHGGAKKKQNKRQRNKNNILYAHDCAYQADMLWSRFTANVCPKLAGKPKIFIIQVSIKGTRV